MFICGSFLHQEHDDLDVLCPSPKSSSKKIASFKKKENKNRYANRGLDKFDALMSELDEKKQKIFTQKGAEDITLVRFVISNENEIKPIVVKVKEKRPSDAKEKTPTSPKLEEALKNGIEKGPQNAQKMKRSLMHIDFNLERLKQPAYYLPVFVMLVLLLLTVYGKSFVILCTSILWYLIPAISGETSRKAKRPRQKELTRRYSDNTFVSSKQHDINGGLSSPTSVIDGPTEMLPGKKHGHRRSF